MARTPKKADTPTSDAENRIAEALRKGSPELDLANFGLTSVPESLGQLTTLEWLNLRCNELTSVPESLGRLVTLQRLYLSSNQLTWVPESIGRLTTLQTLDLSDNKLRSLPDSLGRLAALQRLYLSSNQLTSVPESLGQLATLQELYLGSNELTSIPESLGRLSALHTLDLSVNQLTTVAESFGQLTMLERLDLEYNQLTSVPKSLSRLMRLQRLDLSDNQLTSIPESLERLVNLKALYLHGNEQLGLLPESLGPTWANVSIANPPASPQHLLASLRAMKGAKRRLNAAKILVLGEAKVGKTSLVDFLVNGVACDPDLPTDGGTRGVKIADWDMPVAEEADTETIKVHVWDFGGQEVQHPTHQFFLTERSLYLVVLESRQQEGQGHLDYWLRTIQSKGGDAPILVVVNKADLLSYSLDRRGLKERYHPNLQDFAEVSCKIGDGRGIVELREAIQHQVRDILSRRDAIPETWFRVKEALEGVTKAQDWINDDQYEAICKAHGVGDSREREALIRLLHDLGVIVCFRDDGRLMNLGILNPEWVTDGVYTILTDDGLSRRKGELSREELSGILKDPDRYPAGKHPYLLDLMEKFELCFKYEDESGGHFLVADLLDPEQPGFEWNAKDEVRFLYKYPFLPSSIISRFIVRNHKAIDKKLLWKSGVVLEIDRARALVRSSKADRCVTVAVIGPTPSSRRGAMTVVRKELERINSSLKTEISEWVPYLHNSRRELNYKTLLTWEANRKTILEIEGDNGEILEVNVREHLDGVADSDRVRWDQSRFGINDFRGAHIGGIIMADKVDQSRRFRADNNSGTISGNNLGDVLGDLVQFSKQAPANAGTDLAALVELLRPLIELIDRSAGQVPEKFTKAASEDVEAVVKGAKDPSDNGLLEAAGRALRSLKGMAESFTVTTAAGEKFIELVNKVGDWWEKSGW